MTSSSIPVLPVSPTPRTTINKTYPIPQESWRRWVEAECHFLSHPNPSFSQRLVLGDHVVQDHLKGQDISFETGWKMDQGAHTAAARPAIPAPATMIRRGIIYQCRRSVCDTDQLQRFFFVRLVRARHVLPFPSDMSQLHSTRPGLRRQSMRIEPWLGGRQ